MSQHEFQLTDLIGKEIDEITIDENGYWIQFHCGGKTYEFGCDFPFDGTHEKTYKHFPGNKFTAIVSVHSVSDGEQGPINAHGITFRCGGDTFNHRDLRALTTFTSDTPMYMKYGTKPNQEEWPVSYGNKSA